MLYVFADGLREGSNTFCIPAFGGNLRPMDGRVQLETRHTEEGLLVTVKNYQEDMYAVGLTSEM